MTHHIPTSQLRPGRPSPWPINGDSLRRIKAVDEAIELEEPWDDPLNAITHWDAPEARRVTDTRYE